MRKGAVRVLFVSIATLAAWLTSSMFPLPGARPTVAEEDSAANARAIVPRDLVRLDDGDTIIVAWPEGPEVVRILGIDAPEVFHPEHDIPYAQPFGERAAGFLEGCLAVASRVELLRASASDRYGRTLAYLFLDEKNYSVLAIRARLAVETVTRYGDNGFPEHARACREAAEAAGPVAFEAPGRYRARMREVAARLRAAGTYPCAERKAAKGESR